MKTPIKHLTNHSVIYVDIPQGYMLTLDYNQIIHLMDNEPVM